MVDLKTKVIHLDRTMLKTTWLRFYDCMRIRSKYSAYNKYLIIFENPAALAKNVEINSLSYMVLGEVYIVLGAILE